jgi:hypothetical protein
MRCDRPRTELAQVGEIPPNHRIIPTRTALAQFTRASARERDCVPHERDPVLHELNCGPTQRW